MRGLGQGGLGGMQVSLGAFLWFCSLLLLYKLSITTLFHTDLYCLIQIPYRLFESFVHHVATINIPPKMAASSVISVKWC